MFDVLAVCIKACMLAYRILSMQYSEMWKVESDTKTFLQNVEIEHGSQYAVMASKILQDIMEAFLTKEQQ